MSIGWVIFIILLVLGIILSNILLLKHSANMKMPDSVIKAIEEKKQRELEAALEEQQALEAQQGREKEEQEKLETKKPE